MHTMLEAAAFTRTVLLFPRLFFLFYSGVAMYWSRFTYLTEIQGEWNFLVSLLPVPYRRSPLAAPRCKKKAASSWQDTNWGESTQSQSTHKITAYAIRDTGIHSCLITAPIMASGWQHFCFNTCSLNAFFFFFNKSRLHKHSQLCTNV